MNLEQAIWHFFDMKSLSTCYHLISKHYGQSRWCQTFPLATSKAPLPRNEHCVWIEGTPKHDEIEGIVIYSRQIRITPKWDAMNGRAISLDTFWTLNTFRFQNTLPVRTHYSRHKFESSAHSHHVQHWLDNVISIWLEAVHEFGVWGDGISIMIRNHRKKKILLITIPLRQIPLGHFGDNLRMNLGQVGCSIKLEQLVPGLSPLLGKMALEEITRSEKTCSRINFLDNSEPPIHYLIKSLVGLLGRKPHPINIIQVIVILEWMYWSIPYACLLPTLIKVEWPDQNSYLLFFV